MGGKTKRNIKIKKMKASFFGAIRERAKRHTKKTPDSINTIAEIEREIGILKARKQLTEQEAVTKINDRISSSLLQKYFSRKLHEARISSREQGKIKLYNATAESLKNLSKEKPKRRIRLIYTPMGNKR